jgi:hypothetical protein
VSVSRPTVPPPDGIRGQTPAWNCPACRSELSVVYQKGPRRYACGPCERQWIATVFATVAVPTPELCPCCVTTTLVREGAAPLAVCAACGWDEESGL